MADGNWLRLLAGGRSRTPAKSTSSTPDSSAKTTTAEQNNPPKQDTHQLEQSTGPDTEATAQRRPHGCHSKALSRLPSWPALTQASSTSTGSKSTTPDLFVREADRVAHNPCMDHIVDTLLAAVMSKPALEPLGPEYGSSILHLIEAYTKVKNQALNAQNELTKAAARRKKENEDFETLVTEWTIHEARYKAEIKRLEIIIHRTSDSGLEAVSMARSGSLIRRGSGNVTREQNISPNDKDTRAGGATYHNASKAETSSPRHRHSLIGRPRILDPKSDVTLSMRIDNDPVVDNVTPITQPHATIRQVPSTVSLEDSSSSSSSEAQGSAKSPSGPALERAQILPGSSNFAEKRQLHQRVFSFAKGKNSSTVTQDEVDISDTHSKNENPATKTPHAPPGASMRDGKQSTTSLGTTTPGVGEVPSGGMGNGPPQLRRSREAWSSDVSVARSTSTVRHISRESLDGTAQSEGM